MSVDLSKIKPGDEITVRLHVIESHAGDVQRTRARAMTGEPAIWLRPEDILSHTPKPRPLMAGERVAFVGIHGERNLRGRIIHIHETAAWVDWEAPFPHAVTAISHLERTDD